MWLSMNDAPVIAGTGEAWEEVSHRLRSFIAHRVRSETDAEDIVQEVLLRVHRSIHTLKATERIHAWVYQIARNAIADHHRALGARPEVSWGDAAALADVAHSPRSSADGREDTDPRQELARCLTPMIDRLPDQYRQAILLTEFQGFTQAAVAAQLGLSLSGAKSRVQRGRRRLKAMLLECCRIELDRLGGVSGYEPRDGSCSSCRVDDACR